MSNISDEKRLAFEDYIRDYRCPPEHYIRKQEGVPRFYEDTLVGKPHLCLKDAKFGDVVNVADGNAFYTGFWFVGSGGDLYKSYRSKQWSIYDGITVPYHIASQFRDAVSYYQNVPFTIVCYELAYHDVTVQKYNVAPGYLYEYKYNKSTKSWSLEMISKDGSRMTAMMKEKW